MEKLLYKGTRKLPEIFSEEEINLILNQILACKDYWKKGHYKDWADFLRWRDISLIATIYLLALRPKEACKLKFTDFNFRQAVIKIRGENNKVRKDRMLPIPATLIKILKNYLQFPKARFWKGSQYLFPSFQNSFISPERLKHIFREKCLKPLGLWEMPTENKVSKFRLYTLRHSRLSHLYNKHKDIFLISNLAGHSDIRSSLVYLHTDKSYQDYMRKMINL